MDRPRKAPSEPPEGAGSVAELAALLKSFRASAGLSQQALADRAAVSVQAVSALERGYRKAPYRETLERIADALGLPAEARAALELSARRARVRAAEEAVPAHNLPRQLTAFVGRDEAVAEIAGLVTTRPSSAPSEPAASGRPASRSKSACGCAASFPTASGSSNSRRSPTRRW